MSANLEQIVEEIEGAMAVEDSEDVLRRHWPALKAALAAATERVHAGHGWAERRCVGCQHPMSRHATNESGTRCLYNGCRCGLDDVSAAATGAEPYERIHSRQDELRVEESGGAGYRVVKDLRGCESALRASAARVGELSRPLRLPAQATGDGTSGGALSVFARGWNGYHHELLRLNPDVVTTDEVLGADHRYHGEIPPWREWLAAAESARDAAVRERDAAQVELVDLRATVRDAITRGAKVLSDAEAERDAALARAEAAEGRERRKDEALRPFADQADYWERLASEANAPLHETHPVTFTIKECRAARDAAALRPPVAGPPIDSVLIHEDDDPAAEWEARVRRGLAQHGIELRPPVAGEDKPARPEIVCLSGSSRFVDVVAVQAWELEKNGAITLAMHLLPEWYGAEAHHQAEAEGVAVPMDELHLRKIDLADRVLVCNVGGYIGESTRREIEYATKIGKPIAYLEPVSGGGEDAREQHAGEGEG